MVSLKNKKSYKNNRNNRIFLQILASLLISIPLINI